MRIAERGDRDKEKQVTRPRLCEITELTVWEEHGRAADRDERPLSGANDRLVDTPNAAPEAGGQDSPGDAAIV
jgi:hypothetical protein